MRRSRSVHTVRLVLGLVAVSLSVLGAVRGEVAPQNTTAQSTIPTAAHG